MSEVERARLAVLATEIGEEVGLAERAFRDAVVHAIAAGEKLIEAKSLVAHGEWLAWLEANCPVGEREARNYMRLARESATVADLPTIREAVAALTTPRINDESQWRQFQRHLRPRFGEAGRYLGRFEMTAERVAWLQRTGDEIREEFRVIPTEEPE